MEDDEVLPFDPDAFMEELAEIERALPQTSALLFMLASGILSGGCSREALSERVAFLEGYVFRAPVKREDMH